MLPQARSAREQPRRGADAASAFGRTVERQPRTRGLTDCRRAGTPPLACERVIRRVWVLGPCDIPRAGDLRPDCRVHSPCAESPRVYAGLSCLSNANPSRMSRDGIPCCTSCTARDTMTWCNVQRDRHIVTITLHEQILAQHNNFVAESHSPEIGSCF